MAYKEIRTAVQSFDEVRHALSSLAQRPSVKTVTADYTATGGEDVILIDASSNTVTVTLPDATKSEGATYWVKAVDVTNTAKVTAAAGNIDGAADYTFSSQYESITVSSDGSNWWIV